MSRVVFVVLLALVLLNLGKAELLSFGKNLYGEAMTGDVQNNLIYPSPVEIIYLKNSLKKVVAGNYMMVFLLKNGSCFTAGSNTNGQTGDGTTTTRTIPGEILKTGVNFTEATTGATSTIALTDTGDAYSFGSNAYGQLGDGTTIQRPTPVLVSASNISQVSCGIGHCVLLRFGKPYGFGRNIFGELGDGTKTQRNSPTIMDINGTFTQIQAGDYHSLLLKNDGTVYSVGYNNFGQLGDGFKVNRENLMQVNYTGSPIIQIGAGGRSSLILNSQGILFGFGYNSNGNLGNGMTSSVANPTMVQHSSSKISKISISGDKALIQDEHGKVYAFGQNINGGCGIGNTQRSVIVPTLVNLNSNFTDISAGLECSVVSNGDHHYASGHNFYNQFVLPPQPVGLSIPRLLNDTRNYTQISVGASHTISVTDDGNLFTVGSNSEGQLGDGTYLNRIAPKHISFPKKVTRIAAGDDHSLIVLSDGTCHSFGLNENGQLGDGTTTNKYSPVQIDIGPVNLISAGEKHSIFLLNNGSLLGCGINNNGQLGEGTSSQKVIPVINKYTGPQIIDISSGGNHNLILASDRTLWSHGRNTNGQLGDGTKNGKFIAIQISMGSVKIHSISAGFEHSFVLSTTGDAYVFGRGANGRLGLNNLNDQTSPQLVATGISIVKAARSHSIIINKHGKVFTFGFNYQGQLGNGNLTENLVPAPILYNGPMNFTFVASSDATILSTFGSIPNISDSSPAPKLSPTTSPMNSIGSMPKKSPVSSMGSMPKKSPIMSAGPNPPSSSPKKSPGNQPAQSTQKPIASSGSISIISPLLLVLLFYILI